jgi:DNA-directed RNA polymerase specialized sigma24 family protein
LAIVLLRHHRLLRDYARHFMQDATDDAVEDAVERTIERLLARSAHQTPHALRLATWVLRGQCKQTERRLQLERAPIDPLLGPLTGRVLRVLERMGPLARDTILQVARGKTPTEIAQAEKTDPSNVRVRLYKARKRALELLNEGRQSSSAVVVLLTSRARSAVTRNIRGVAEVVAPHGLASGALVPLIATALLWQTTFMSTPHLPSQAIALAPGAGAALPPVAAPTLAAMPSTGAASPPRAPTPAAATQPTPPPLVAPDRTAASETPEDVMLTALATPADGRPVLVAIGKGHTCNCPVLLQSMDGGATWASTDGPPMDAAQLALPPDYPRDARIFAGVDPLLGRAPYMTDAFGKPFQQLLGLPPGPVAVSAHFDDGDPRVFTAGATAVWSMPIGGTSRAVAHNEIDYSAEAGASAELAALATPPPSAGGPALLVWAPALAVTPASPASPPLDAPLLRCPVAAPCHVSASIPTPPWRLVAQGSSTVVAYTPTRAYMSHDGGASFAPIPNPGSTAALESVVLVGTSIAPWSSFARPDGSYDVARLATPAGAWEDVAGDAAVVRTHLGVLVAVGTDRIIEAFPDAGYRCILSSGGSWAARCPAA